MIRYHWASVDGIAQIRHHSPGLVLGIIKHDGYSEAYGPGPLNIIKQTVDQEHAAILNARHACSSVHPSAYQLRTLRPHTKEGLTL